MIIIMLQLLLWVDQAERRKALYFPFPRRPLLDQQLTSQDSHHSWPQITRISLSFPTPLPSFLLFGIRGSCISSSILWSGDKLLFMPPFLSNPFSCSTHVLFICPFTLKLRLISTQSAPSPLCSVFVIIVPLLFLFPIITCPLANQISKHFVKGDTVHSCCCCRHLWQLESVKFMGRKNWTLSLSSGLHFFWSTRRGVGDGHYGWFTGRSAGINKSIQQLIWTW